MTTKITCSACNKKFRWYRKPYECSDCDEVFCASCKMEHPVCSAIDEHHEHHHIFGEIHWIQIPSKMKIGDYTKYCVCESQTVQIAKEIYNNPVLRTGKLQYEQGYDEGHQIGYDKGLKKGHAEGYDKGYQEGYRKGYRDGED